MKKSYLIKTLKSFSKKEMFRFVEFSNSDYHNKHRGIKKLVHFLNKHYPSFPEAKLNVHSLIEEFSNEKDFNQQKLSLLFTYTGKVLEEFMIFEELKKDSIESNTILLRALRSRKLYGPYEKKLASLKKQKSKYTGSQHLQMTYSLNAEQQQFFNLFSNRENHIYFENKQSSLESFFIAEKLKDACEFVVRKKLYNLDKEYSFIQKIIEYIEQDPNILSEQPSINIYYNLYNLLEKREASNYQNTISLVQKYHVLFPKEELQNIYNYLKNFCIEKVNKGDASFVSELFRIYKSQLKEDLLLVNDQLPEFHYKNIVTIGLRLKAYDWVFDFLNQYKSHLSPIIQSNAYTYNLANYYYETFQPLKTVELLSKVEYTDARYNVDAKSLLLKTYFDLNEEFAFMSLVNSFKQYLNRTRQLSSDRKQGYSNFLKSVKKLFQIKIQIEYYSKKILNEEHKKTKKYILNLQPIFNQKWLEMKLAEIQLQIISNEA